MANSDLHASKLSLAYAKIVATPTNIGWSQVYNAGSLFAILSLTVKDQVAPIEINLPALGKDIFNDLEAEFFSLEEKTLPGIKAAMEKSFEKIIPGIIADASLAYFKDNLLYLFMLGKGKILMKRGEKLGLLLEKKTNDTAILTSSGRLQPGDIILLQSDHFTQNVPDANITAAFELQLPSGIAESLSPHVHEKEDGGQAAIIIAYNGAVQAPNPLEENIIPVQEPMPKETDNAPLPLLTSLNKFIKKFKLPTPHLTKRQISALCLGVVLLILLTSSIIFTKTQQENAKYEALYQQISTQAQKNYDEGKALAKLNQNLAQDDFIKAEKILKENINKFKTNSKEQLKLQALLDQVKAELAPTAAPVNKLSPVAANVGEFDLLTIEKNNQALAYTQDDASIYLLTDKAVTTIDKANGTKKDILLNNKDWGQAVALSPYQGNIYVLDQKAGILKFVAAQEGFGKTDYFKGTPPNLSKAQSLSIDGSIWILTSDGKILKYTKGEPDNFAVTGLDKPLKNPSKIFTNRDIDNLYILDNGNGRILKLDKNGVYQNQYNSDILLSVLDFEVLEKDKKILILTKDKIWEIPL
jgi:hypothetical protein